jgi:uncharacterized membrane protein HdeD (DUF308 family)
MAQAITRSVREPVNYWWLFLLSGLILIGIGIWVFASPVAAYISLSILFAVSIFAIGIFETMFAISSRKSLDGWGWSLATGILDIVIGGFLLFYPAISMAVLPFVLGFWLMFRGISAIGFAFDMRSYGTKGWGWFLALGILIVLFSIAIVAVPAFGVINVVIWTGLSFITAGVFRITLAFSLRKLRTA